MASDLDELELIHPAALYGDDHAIDECLNALPGLIAELRALREVAEAARFFAQTEYCGGPLHHRIRLRAALAKVTK